MWEGLSILSALTPDAVEGLGLREGMPVWALVKSGRHRGIDARRVDRTLGRIGDLS